VRVVFWGARGSVPSSHPGNMKYGGNTSCVEIRTRSNDLIVLDCGTGLRRLGVKMMSQFTEADAVAKLEKTVEFMVESLMETITVEKPKTLRALEGSLEYKDKVYIFLSHFHWDHIQGFPFFIPAYLPDKQIHIHGQLKADHRLSSVFTGQMSRTYFPVYLDQMQSEKFFHEILEDTVNVGDATVTSRVLNHPQGCLGYRIVCGEMIVTYATDTEHPEKGIDENMLELADGADVLIYDCQYTPDEYESKKSWGHSTWEKGVEIAREAGAKKLILFHHDPEHNDEFIDLLELEVRDHFPNVMAAYEGLVIADFPVEPTLEISIPEPSESELSEMPEIVKSGTQVTVTSGPSMRPLSEKQIQEKLKSELEGGADRIVFDCSKVSYTDRLELVTLADTIENFAGNGMKMEIIHPGRDLHRKLIDARFSLAVKLPQIPLADKL